MNKLATYFLQLSNHVKVPKLKLKVDHRFFRYGLYNRTTSFTKYLRKFLTTYLREVEALDKNNSRLKNVLFCSLHLPICVLTISRTMNLEPSLVGNPLFKQCNLLSSIFLNPVF